MDGRVFLINNKFKIVCKQSSRNRDKYNLTIDVNGKCIHTGEKVSPVIFKQKTQ